MKRTGVIISLIFISIMAYSQKETNYWYFGDYAGLNFVMGTTLPLTNGALSTGEGCAAISTSSGNLQFYTDGRYVYDRYHNQMPNGFGLFGHSSGTQSAIIIPKPFSNSKYYIFTTDAWDNNLAHGLCYSLVDMTLNNGSGDVVVSEKNVVLVPLTCEKVTAIRHGDGLSIWVITHKWGTDEFYAYKVTSSGVNTTPVISHAGESLIGDMQASKGQLKLSPDGSWVAMANNTAFTVGIFHFSNTTGTVTHFATDHSYINPGGYDPGGPYGVEFSPNSSRLYIGEWKANRKIYQYDLSSNDPTIVLNSKTMVASVGQGDDPIGALQLGPDNRLYVARMNCPYLSRINAPNLTGIACNFTDNAINLAGRESTYGLPSFVQSFFNIPGLVAWYPFNGNANDESGHGYHGTAYGATITADRFGNPNSAYYFDGISNYISANLYNLPTVSISFWYQSPAPNNAMPCFTMYNNFYCRQVGEGQSPYGFIYARKQIAQDEAYEAFSDSAPLSDEWHHVYLDWTGSASLLKLYVDGIFQDTGNFIPEGDLVGINDNTVFFGASSILASSNYLTGNLDDIRIYDRALTESEILSLFDESVIVDQEICLVAVTVDDDCKLIWEKQPSAHIDNYNVYRETSVNNVYEMIGSVAYEDSSLFFDTTADPQNLSHKYKISAVLLSGTESDLSNYHRTIYLTISTSPEGWKLSWNPYTGFPFGKYYIYRGPAPGNLTLLDSVTSSYTSYTDLDPPVGPLYYSIEVVNEAGCNPSREGGYDRSRSNVRFNGLTGIAEHSPPGIRIFPNPAYDVLNIELEELPERDNGKIVIYSIHGMKMLSQTVTQVKTSIDTKALSSGIYLIHLKLGDVVVTRRLAVMRSKN